MNVNTEKMSISRSIKQITKTKNKGEICGEFYKIGWKEE